MKPEYRKFREQLRFYIIDLNDLESNDVIRDLVKEFFQRISPIDGRRPADSRTGRRITKMLKASGR